MPILKYRANYKPFEYPDIVKLVEEIQDRTWFTHEIAIADDLSDFADRLTKNEQDSIIRILSGFAAADNEIRNSWVTVYGGSPLLSKPEVSDAISVVAAQEVVHAQFYSLLIDTLQLPESTYTDFLEQPTAASKIEALTAIKTPKKPEDILRAIAKISFGGEGIQLFAAFNVLMHFGAKSGTMMGCYSGNVFSARDELTHVKLALALFNIIKAEYPKAWTDEVKEDCRNSIISAAKNELNYATFVMGGVDLPELKLEDVWRYIKYITNARLKDAGLRQYFKVYELPRESRWFEEALHGTGHGNFFEVRNNEYSMTGFVGEIDWGVKPKEE